MTITFLHELVKLIDSAVSVVVLDAILEGIVLILLCLPVCFGSELVEVIIGEVVVLHSPSICRGIGEEVADGIIMLNFFSVCGVNDSAHSTAGIVLMRELSCIAKEMPEKGWTRFNI
jgi:hypothetical protein